MSTTLPIDDLTRLLSEKPELVEALRGAASPEDAAEMLASAAKENGIAVDKAQLAAFHAEHAGSANAKLSDADLDNVAGGVSGEGILFSIISGGIGCLAVSLAATIGCDNVYKKIFKI